MQEKYNFNEVMNTPQLYVDLVDEIQELLFKQTISSRNNKIILVIDDVETTCTVGRLYVNLLMLYLLVGKGVKEFKDLFINDKHLTPDVQAKVFNKLLDTADELGIDYDEYQDKLAETINKVSDAFSTTNKKVGASPAIMDFIKMEALDPAAHRIMNIKLKNNLMYDEVEHIFHTLSVLLLKTISSHPENSFSRFVTPESGVNLKQSTQSFCMGGLKPDIDGSIINYVIENSYYHGLKSDMDYYIDAKGTRKALITNHDMVSVAGYLNQKLTLLMMDTTLDTNVEDCGTKNVVIYDIQSKKFLNLVDDRYYYNLNEDGSVNYDNLYYLDAKHSQHLIGKKIALRTPEVCGCRHDSSSSKVCKTCYGKHLYELNKDKHAGIIAVLFLMNILTQMLLSAKHLLTTNAQALQWPEIIENYFDISFQTLMFNGEADIKIDIPSITYENYNEEHEAYSVAEFDIQVNDEKMHVVSPTPLYVNPLLVSIENTMIYTEENSIHINSNNLPEECEYIFEFEQDNSELSTALMSIINILDTTSHLGYETYQDITNRLAELLIESNINNKIKLVHLELLVRELLVEADTLKPVDWGNPTADKEYSILRVTKALLNKPLSISLSFERIGSQLAELNTFSKDGVSIYDEIYK